MRHTILDTVDTSCYAATSSITIENNDTCGWIMLDSDFAGAKTFSLHMFLVRLAISDTFLVAHSVHLRYQMAASIHYLHQRTGISVTFGHWKKTREIQMWSISMCIYLPLHLSIYPIYPSIIFRCTYIHICIQVYISIHTYIHIYIYVYIYIL